MYYYPEWAFIEAMVNKIDSRDLIIKNPTKIGKLGVSDINILITDSSNNKINAGNFNQLTYIAPRNIE